MSTIIACIGENNELGKGGSLIWHIKEDLKFFKDTTMGHAVLMGYNTWASLPKQLSGRDCYVLMHRTEKFFEDPEARADNLAKGLDIDSPEDLPDRSLWHCQLYTYSYNHKIPRWEQSQSPEVPFPPAHLRKIHDLLCILQ